MKAAAKQWFERSRYDLETAVAMQRTGRYLYVAFMCQQAVEKHLKGLICAKTGQMPPYVHNLTVLAEHLRLGLADAQLDLLDILSNYYINARYPVVKQRLARLLDKKESADMLRQTKDFIRWLQRR